MRWVSKIAIMVAVGALVSTSGCQAPASVARIATLQVPEASAHQHEFSQQRLLIRRFTDTRPATVGKRIGGGGFVIPAGYRSEQTTEVWDEREDDGPTVYQGWLPADLPYLLATSLPGDNVAVADALVDAGASGRWDYIVEGRVLQTRHEAKTSVVLIWLGLVGVPTGFHRYELSYELSLYDGRFPDDPVMTRVYTFDERVTEGLYYNGKRSRHLPLRALETTVARSANDLVAEVTKHRARRAIAPENHAVPPQGT